MQGRRVEGNRERREQVYREELLRRTNSKQPKKAGHGKLILVLVILILIAGGVLAYVLLNHQDLYKAPATIVFDDSVTSEEKAFITSRFEKLKETRNYNIYNELKISAETTYKIDTNTVNKLNQNNISIVYDLLLPTVDFYDSELNISSSEAEKSTDIKWVSLREITPENRVVSIDDNYWFDSYNEGAKYRILNLESSDANENSTVATVVSKFTNDTTTDGKENLGSSFPFDKQDYLSFAQTGVTALTRAMTITLNGRANGNGAYFAENIKDFLSAKDITHISNEVSFTDNCKGSTGTMSLCADWRSLDSITAIGTDIVELSGNHNNNYGTEANIKTIEKYHELGMKTVGGGINEEEAAKPLELEEKGVKINFLAYNHSTSTKGNGELANGNKPGANGFTEEKAKADIAAAKERGGIILVDIQFSECYSYPAEGQEMPSCDAPIAGQKAFFRQFIDWGADIVVGTQAHQPQTFELYEGKPIYYGLGNLFFDQTYWPGTQRGYILTHYFDNKTGKLLNTRISPTFYDTKHQVYLTDETTSEKFIARLMNSSPEGK